MKQKQKIAEINLYDLDGNEAEKLSAIDLVETFETACFLCGELKRVKTREGRINAQIEGTFEQKEKDFEALSRSRRILKTKIVLKLQGL